MPLTLVVEGDMASPVPSSRGMSREGLPCLLIMFVFISLRNFLASYYPGRGQTTHPLASFPTVPFDPADSDNSGIESEGEWLGDRQLVELAEGPSCRISEALANEVCRRHFL